MQLYCCIALLTYVKVWAEQDGKVCEMVALAHNASLSHVHCGTTFLRPHIAMETVDRGRKFKVRQKVNDITIEMTYFVMFRKLQLAM